MPELDLRLTLNLTGLTVPPPASALAPSGGEGGFAQTFAAIQPTAPVAAAGPAGVSRAAIAIGTTGRAIGLDPHAAVAMPILEPAVPVRFAGLPVDGEPVTAETPPVATPLPPGLPAKRTTEALRRPRMPADPALPQTARQAGAVRGKDLPPAHAAAAAPDERPAGRADADASVVLPDAGTSGAGGALRPDLSAPSGTPVAVGHALPHAETVVARPAGALPSVAVPEPASRSDPAVAEMRTTDAPQPRVSAGIASYAPTEETMPTRSGTPTQTGMPAPSGMPVQARTPSRPDTLTQSSVSFRSEMQAQPGMPLRSAAPLQTGTPPVPGTGRMPNTPAAQPALETPPAAGQRPAAGSQLAPDLQPTLRMPAASGALLRRGAPGRLVAVPALSTPTALGTHSTPGVRTTLRMPVTPGTLPMAGMPPVAPVGEGADGKPVLPRVHPAGSEPVEAFVASPAVVPVPQAAPAVALEQVAGAAAPTVPARGRSEVSDLAAVAGPPIVDRSLATKDGASAVPPAMSSAPAGQTGSAALPLVAGTAQPQSATGASLPDAPVAARPQGEAAFEAVPLPEGAPTREATAAATCVTPQSIEPRPNAAAQPERGQVLPLAVASGGQLSDLARAEPAVVNGGQVSNPVRIEQPPIGQAAPQAAAGGGSVPVASLEPGRVEPVASPIVEAGPAGEAASATVAPAEPRSADVAAAAQTGRSPEPAAPAAVFVAGGERGEVAPARPRRAPAPLVLTSIDAPIHRLAPAGIAAPAPLEAAPAVRDDSWMRAMIDQIETAVEGTQREARIRLSPDALGSVEVRISSGADGVAVQLSADNPAARALLAEGAPRLAELADARGLRLSQAQVDAGTSGGGRNQHQPQQSAAAAPNRAPARTDDQPAGRDSRLA